MMKAKELGENVFVISEGRTRRQLVKHEVYKGVKSSRTFHQVRSQGGKWVNADLVAPKVLRVVKGGQ